MKLSEQYDLDRFHHDVNWRAPAFVRDHLVVTGLDELASIDFWDEDVRKFYVATDAGLYVGSFTPRRDIRFDPKLEATVTPWREVAGVRLAIATEVGEATAVTLSIENPTFERTANRDAELRPLADFGRVCLVRHGRA